MSDGQASVISAWLLGIFLLLFLLVMLFATTFGRSARDDFGNIAKIECLAHGDDAGVHAFCVKEHYVNG